MEKHCGRLFKYVYMSLGRPTIILIWIRGKWVERMATAQYPNQR
jgi:hypothetical protein